MGRVRTPHFQHASTFPVPSHPHPIPVIPVPLPAPGANLKRGSCPELEKCSQPASASQPVQPAVGPEKSVWEIHPGKKHLDQPSRTKSNHHNSCNQQALCVCGYCVMPAHYAGTNRSITPPAHPQLAPFPCVQLPFCGLQTTTTTRHSRLVQYHT